MFGIWKKAAAKVTIGHPFFIELMYSMKYVEGEQYGATAATDGTTIYANPKYFADKQEDFKLFVLLHEFMHVAMLHPWRRNGRNPYIWNLACDYAINPILEQMGLNRGEGIFDERFVGMHAEKIYDILIEENPKIDFTIDLLDPKGSPKEQEEQRETMRRVIVKCAANAKAIGQMPAALEGLVAAAAASKEEPWQQHLHRWLQKSAASDFTWERVSRRALHTLGVFSPDVGNRSLGKISIFIDTSGSCFSVAEQNYFCSHVNAILGDCNPEQVHVYYFDTRVNKKEVFNRGETNVQLHPSGSGGTDFRDIFNQMEEGFEPVAAIVLTDLYGPTGKEPPFPVIWAITSTEKAPFGDSVYLKGQQ